MAIAIVCGAFISVAQHLVSLACLLELLLRAAVPRIAVRMELHSLLAICAFQFLVAGVARYAEHLVVICFAHCCLWTHSLVCFELWATRTSAGRSRRSRSR